MTAKEFDSLTDPEEVWKVFARHTDYRGRKQILAALALSGMLAHLLKNPQTLRAIELLEQFAETTGTTEQWAEAAVEADEGAEFCSFRVNATDAQGHAASAVNRFSQLSISWGMQVARNAIGKEHNYGKKSKAAEKAAEKAQSRLLRELLGNPFRPVTFDPAWRSDTAVSLAKHIYESRDFSAMPILADALQDAGCDNAEILTHCRGKGPHVRGCWVVDLVLDKS